MAQLQLQLLQYIYKKDFSFWKRSWSTQHTPSHSFMKARVVTTDKCCLKISLVAEASPRIGLVSDPLPLWVGTGQKTNHQFMFSIQMLLSWHWVSVLRPMKARWRCTPIITESKLSFLTTNALLLQHKFLYQDLTQLWIELNRKHNGSSYMEQHKH